MKYRWPALLGLALCLALLLGWCPGECNKGTLLLLPWAAWGAAFYLCCLLVPQPSLKFLAGLGLMVHAYLMRVMVVQGELCITCVTAAGLTLALFISSLPLPLAQRAIVGGLTIILFAAGALLWDDAPELASTTGSGPVKVADAAILPPVGIAPSGANKTPEPAPRPAPKSTPVDTGMAVVTPGGETVRLDPAKRPVLMFAWWCSHCNDALRTVASLPEEKRPYLVSVYSRGQGEKVVSKLRALGLTGTYYISDREPDSVPCLLVGADIISGTDRVCAYLKTLRARQVAGS